jgi:hypothetical protein
VRKYKNYSVVVILQKKNDIPPKSFIAPSSPLHRFSSPFHRPFIALSSPFHRPFIAFHRLSSFKTTKGSRNGLPYNYSLPTANY